MFNFVQVNNKTQELVYCLPHALQYLSKNKSRIKASLLLFDQTEVSSLFVIFV